MFSYSLVLLSIGTLDLPPPNSLPLPPEFIGTTTSRIYYGSLARQPDLTAARRKSDGGMAEGSNTCSVTFVEKAHNSIAFSCYQLSNKGKTFKAL